MAEHATTIDGLPLIGIPPEATLEMCDCCHDYFHISKVQWNGVQWLCARCQKDWLHDQWINLYDPPHQA